MYQGYPQVCDRILFVGLNTYVHNGGITRHQTKGIPLGTNAAPFLANLYCYHIEAAFVDGLLNARATAEAQRCDHAFCYIDDMMSFCPIWSGLGSFLRVLSQVFVDF